MACGPTRKYWCVLPAGFLTVTRFPDTMLVTLAPFQTRPGSMELALRPLFIRLRLGPSIIIVCLIYLARDSRTPYQLFFSLPFTHSFFFSFPLSSACTCPGEDHPGPSPNKGRGAPEIDVLEAEHNKQGSGGVISQSAQFAPFTHDYLFNNDTDDSWKVYDSSISHANDYRYALTSTYAIVPLTTYFGTVSQGIPGVTCIPFCSVPSHDIYP
jgi:hypothetical protein